MTQSLQIAPKAELAPRPCRVVVIDDSSLQCSIWKRYLEQRFGPRLKVETYTDPRRAVEVLSPDIDLLMLDWEMPELDGMAVLEEARARGVDLKRSVIVSSHPAETLHKVFDCTGCLAVIEKGAVDQQAAFMMIVGDLIRRRAQGRI